MTKDDHQPIMNGETALMALLLTLLAGMATIIGSAIAFFARRTNTRFLAMALGFSAGVMIYVSFVELFPAGYEELGLSLPEAAEGVAVAALFGGILLIAAIDRLVPLKYNPHEMHHVEEVGGRVDPQAQRLMRAGVLTALAIGIHNFPEGLATFMSSMEDLRLGLPVAIAVGIHNIPEGIAVSVPIYYATGSRRQAFLLSALSGLSEPVGALLGFLLLSGVWSTTLLGISLAAVAGIMIFISFDSLLPSAESYGEHHLSVYALVTGMAVMAISLLLL